MTDYVSDAPLPTPRALLTSLLTTLFTSTPPPPPPPPPPEPKLQTLAINSAHSAVKNDQEAENPTNPLKSLPPSQRALLTTLHVLFPPPMLLHSLDLLDRGLVRRISWGDDDEGVNEGGKAGGAEDPVRGRDGDSDEEGGRSRASRKHGREEDEPERETGNERAAMPPPAKVQLPPKSPSAERTTAQTSPQSRDEGQIQRIPSPGNRQFPSYRRTLYQVRSSQQRRPGQRSRFKDLPSQSYGTGGEGKTYTVYLEAWNCNCAAFAFSAFPYQHATSREKRPWGNVVSEPDEGEDEDENAGYEYEHRRQTRRSDVQEGEEEWQFGGLSSDGKEGSGSGSDAVPVCKHLLACLLTERWEILRGFAAEQTVPREEVAGLVVDG